MENLFLTPHMHISLSLLYSFFIDLPENGQVEAETCRRHIL